MSRQSASWSSFVIGLGILTISLALAACATTRQSPSEPEKSGFLGDYSQLREGGEDEAQLVYLNPDTPWSSYDAVLIDSVTLWRDPDTEELPAEEAQTLTDALYAALHEQLGQDYRIADEPGSGVIRLRVAITEVKGASVVTNTVTSVIPQFRLLTTLGGMAAGTAKLVGTAGIEAELTDSVSGERLAAAVDERWGTKAVRGGIGKWSDAKLAFDYWAQRIRERLAALRGS
jgi:hypothetical protein